MITALPSGATADFSLIAKATAQGEWAFTGRGHEPALWLGANALPGILTALASAAEFTPTRLGQVMIYCGKDASNFPYLFAVDPSGASPVFGAPVLVRSLALPTSNFTRIQLGVTSSTKASVALATPCCWAPSRPFY
jgi:hypothetical protein